jgi:coproporphyrinogen III oxidase
MLKLRALEFFKELQDNIISDLEDIDGKPFTKDSWARPEGGGGTSILLENGNVFERGGCNYSHVYGKQLPPSASEHRPELAGQSWEAAGVSLVLHPRNAHIPTVHLNVRMFITESGQGWFGGGMDLTPYYYYEADAVHWHRTCKDALDPIDTALYPKYKQWCDNYFDLKHRNESRGIGGVFFDDLSQPSMEQAFDITRAVGQAFIPAYAPIVGQRLDILMTEEQREWQLYRRGRYVEFNLVYDRGTLFGLQSNGRTESILMSMPPLASWKYDYHPPHGSREDDLLKNLIPKSYV